MGGRFPCSVISYLSLSRYFSDEDEPSYAAYEF